MEDEEAIRETLVSLGFGLTNRGSYWQAKAAWRQGDNPSSIQIYKNSGVWHDHARGEYSQPFGRLIEIASGGRYNLENLAIKRGDTVDNNILRLERKIKIAMDEKYPIELLKNLLPQHNLYINKKISESVINLYKSGYSTQGKMSRRYVFPIFDMNDPTSIIGCSGRSLYWTEGSTMSKWKHLGRKSNWIYPFCIPFDGKLPFLEKYDREEPFYIVESIGDSLAMTQRGLTNHMVSFGLTLSSKQVAKLLELRPEKIVISSNNDANQRDNPGMKGAIKNYFKLSSVFNLERLEIRLCPPNVDLSKLHEIETKDEFKMWLNKKIAPEEQRKYLLKKLNSFEGNSIIKNKKERDCKIKTLSALCGEEEWV